MVPFEKIKLTGDQLEQFLDRVQQVLMQQNDAQLDPELKAATLKALLQSQDYLLHSLNAVARLFRLWVEAKEYSQALKVILHDGHLALKIGPKEDWLDGQLSLI